MDKILMYFLNSKAFDFALIIVLFIVGYVIINYFCATKKSLNKVKSESKEAINKVKSETKLELEQLKGDIKLRKVEAKAELSKYITYDKFEMAMEKLTKSLTVQINGLERLLRAEFKK